MKRIILTTVAALLVLTGIAVVRPLLAEDRRELTVMFPKTTSLYEGAQVKVLGVRIGTVESIEVEGTEVRVHMTYDADVELPADVHAVIVPPSVVGDRFVQLAPAYTGGEVLADGAELGVERSGVPLELEDTYRALDQVASALGPRAGNRDGALSRLISAGADNLRGRGRLLNSTIRGVADALAVLAGSSDSINGTTTDLDRLTRRLAGSDATIRSVVANLVAVASDLNGQGRQLTVAVGALDRALGRLATFARDNREDLRASVDDLTSVTVALRRHTAELEEITELAPVGLVSLLNTYVPGNWDPTDRSTSVIDGRTGSQNLRAALLQDLDLQLSYLLGAVCAYLPGGEAAQLAPFCTALENVGGSLGQLVSGLYNELPLPQMPGHSRSMPGIADRAGGAR